VGKYLILLWTAGCCLFADNNWMNRQIADDLAGFEKESLAVSDVNDTYELDSRGEKEFVKIHIINGKVKLFQHGAHVKAHGRRQVLKEYFKELVKGKALPDTTFIVALSDGLNFEAGFKVPIFTFAKEKRAGAIEKDTILLPDFESLKKQQSLIAKCRKASAQYPWKKKRDKVYWRGAMTGGTYREDDFLKWPRVKLVYLSKADGDSIDARFVKTPQPNQHVINRIIGDTFPLVKKVPRAKHFAYKYLIDIDGNSCTYARCRWIMLSNSVLLKPDSANIQWYYSLLEPYENYIPLAADLSDIKDQIFWLKTHDSEGESIALRATQLGEEIFSKKCIDRYVRKAIKAYSGLFGK